jgi:hypothetical protein
MELPTPKLTRQYLSAPPLASCTPNATENEAVGYNGVNVANPDGKHQRGSEQQQQQQQQLDAIVVNQKRLISMVILGCCSEQ